MKYKTKHIIGAGLLGIAAWLLLRPKKNKTPMTGNYFTIEELSKSDTAQRNGIDNTPTPEARQNLQALIDNILNPARRLLGTWIIVNSGYRSPLVNKLVGGAATSQHTTGEAADITAGTKKLNRILFAIIANMGNYDQLIWEGDGSWIHVSYKANGNNRGSMLAQTSSGGYVDIKNNWKNYI